MTAYQESRSVRPVLPVGRGELSHAVIAALAGGRPLAAGTETVRADPYGDDLQLALYVLYELHYQGFAGVDDEREWDPELLEFRRVLEQRFLESLRCQVRSASSAEEALAALLVEPVVADHEDAGVSHHLQREGSLENLREYAALRSLYHLKEADPHAWVLPRLYGRAKAAMAAVEFDEFGAGRAQDLHARLYADLMEDLSLDIGYGHYLDAAPAEALATVNQMSLFGLHRSLRGALVGHFAAVEVTSSPGSRRLAQAMRRTGAGPAAERFYDEHVEADAVHEQIVRRDVIGGLLADEPQLEADIAFGIESTKFLEDRLGAHLLHAWRGNRSALRRPLNSVLPTP
ncbi:iron-containing redox enzyme family protein [Streptomyces sp. SID13666]|uniref:iron-containing redox enzyme family protein n=1 Tax=unclassified Streptomyces TaxID=2593676 RepID=UPI0013BEC459|nr:MULTISPECIES: iron-containing redox enzyme family protein [unclassified Streptomyces]NEA53027.1 iron-containing redox enzyme family protein [Streptomyces sp. SID13666]NEA69646.1 iron-containing redox enzyme family protein [Streptomyces sp. SID13588]